MSDTLHRNIWLAYVLTFCKNSWFWLGIWVFYYLRFTDYAGIGLIETVLIVTMTIAEIPTGAVADLFGKKKTLFISFFLQACGAFWMAFTSNVWHLGGSVLLMGIGGAFYSGTLEAFVYDTLKSQGDEQKFSGIISTVNSLQLLTIAACGFFGGFIYSLFFRLPFVLNTFFYTIGMIATFFLTEPTIDSEKFSWANYVHQTKQGLSQLFKSSSLARQTLLLLSVGVIGVILDEMLYSFLGYEFGLKPESIGVAWAVIYLVSALVLRVVPYFNDRWGNHLPVFFLGGMIAITLLLSPVLGLVTGLLAILVSSASLALFTNLTSILINRQTESKYRATTLSTFNMLKNVPYVLVAYMFGALTDTYSARYTAMGLGFILILLLVIQLRVNHPTSDQGSFSRGKV